MKITSTTLILSSLALANAGAVTLWQVGTNDNAEGFGPGNLPPVQNGGVNAVFVQETMVNPLPGSPISTPVNQGADDDYYFAGTYPGPIGLVTTNEISVERAHTGGDQSLRFHFNLPGSLSPTDDLSISFDYYNVDRGDSDPGTPGNQPYPERDPSLFWDIDVLYNGNLVTSFNVTDELVRDTLNNGTSNTLTSPTFNLGDFGSSSAPGADNYVTLRGTNGGSNSRWISLDYIQLDATPVPEPSAALLLGLGGMGSFLMLRRRRG